MNRLLIERNKTLKDPNLEESKKCERERLGPVDFSVTRLGPIDYFSVTRLGLVDFSVTRLGLVDFSVTRLCNF